MHLFNEFVFWSRFLTLTAFQPRKSMELHDLEKFLNPLIHLIPQFFLPFFLFSFCHSSHCSLALKLFYTLSANPTKWSNSLTSRQIV